MPVKQISLQCINRRTKVLFCTFTNFPTSGSLISLTWLDGQGCTMPASMPALLKEQWRVKPANTGNKKGFDPSSLGQ